MTSFRAMKNVFLIALFTLCGALSPIKGADPQEPIPHWTAFFSDTPEIRRELSRLYAKSPSVRALMDELAKTEATVILSQVLLPSSRTMARTRVHDNNSAEIAVDMRKAKASDNSLALTLAHELYHVKDGLINHAPGTFHQVADESKFTNWRARPHEKVAIDFAETVKGELFAAK